MKVRLCVAATYNSKNKFVAHLINLCDVSHSLIGLERHELLKDVLGENYWIKSHLSPVLSSKVIHEFFVARLMRNLEI